MELMPRTRRIRQVLEPNIAKQEVKNISKLYRAMGWSVHKSVAVENGVVVHKILANKGGIASIIVELKEAVKDKKGNGKRGIKDNITRPRPETSDHPKRRKMDQKTKNKPSQWDSLRKEELKAYAEQDNTGIILTLIAEGAIVLEDGAVQFTRLIERAKFLHTREYFKRAGLKWTTNFRMERNRCLTLYIKRLFKSLLRYEFGQRALDQFSSTFKKVIGEN